MSLFEDIKELSGGKPHGNVWWRNQLFWALEGADGPIPTTAVTFTAVGADSLKSTTTGSSNVGVGYSTGAALTTGSNNVCIGTSALQANVTGSSNTILGNRAYRLVILVLIMLVLGLMF